MYQWSAGQRASRHVPRPRRAASPDPEPPPAARPGRVSAAEVFGQLLADLEQWARLTGKLASHGRASDA